MKRKIAFLSVVFALAFASATDAVFENDLYSLRVSYNDSAKPGDAVFVRIIFSRTKKQATAKGATRATLTLGKASADFYAVQPRGGERANPDSYVELLGYLPISTWKESEQTEITVLYSAFGSDNMSFKLPFAIEKKDFINETIALDERNTSLQTDTSAKRAAQIDTLNQILVAKRADGVYQQGAFSPPVTATRRTSFFGDRRIYAYSTGRTSTTEHYGIDYGVPTGTPVQSCAAGRVVLADERVTTGWSVVIEHLPGLYSLYYHMDSLSVKTGQTVKQGEEIGKSGATGVATGPHLHWEMRLNGSAVNPDFFTGDFSFFSDKR